MEELIIIDAKGIDVLNPALYADTSNVLAVQLFESSQMILMNKTTRLMMQSPALSSFIQSIKPTKILEANISETAQQMLDKGEWLLKYSKTKDGFLPVLVDKSNHFVHQVTLKSKEIAPQLSDSLTSLATQQQLAAVMQQLEMMNNSIQRIERGQRDDRIGLFYSARQQFIEASVMSDGLLQEQALLNAAKTANDARFLLMQTLKSDVQEIINNKKLSKKERDKLSDGVRDSMRYINDSTGLCIAAFSALGEQRSVQSAMMSYKCFIENTLLCEVKGENLLVYEALHSNWAGSDNEWLSMPKNLVSTVDKAIQQAAQVVMIEEDGGEDE
jgi:hypothetical protein